MNKLDMMINFLAADYPDYENAKIELKKEFFSRLKDEVNINGLEFDDAYDLCLNELNAEYQFKSIELFDERFNNFMSTIESLISEDINQIAKIYDEISLAVIDSIIDGYGEEQLDHLQEIADELNAYIEADKINGVNVQNIDILFQ